MKNKLYLFVFLLQVLALSVHAARVDTVFVKSPSMNREVKVVYILPDKAVAGNPPSLSGNLSVARLWRQRTYVDGCQAGAASDCR